MKHVVHYLIKQNGKKRSNCGMLFIMKLRFAINFYCQIISGHPLRSLCQQLIINKSMSNKYEPYMENRRKSYGKSLDRESNTYFQSISQSQIPDSYHVSKPYPNNGLGYFSNKVTEQSVQSLKDFHHKHEYYPSLKSLKLKWKLNDMGLRETEDSIRHQSWKQGIGIRDFRKIKLLGKGRHGTVFMAVHKETGFIGALKVFHKQDFYSNSKQQREMLQSLLIKQLKIQSFTNHESILKVYSIFSDEKCFYLFMELGTDGQLFDVFNFRKTLKEESISFVVRSLLEAIKYLHKHNIIHRDLKPENIVLIHGFPKICDFGQSSVCNKSLGELRETLCGTPLYLSPEILKGSKYDEKIDIWALGAMTYELFTGDNPFNIKHKQELNKIITEEFKMTKGSIELQNFLIYCMKKNPKERPSAEKLLRHPFIKKWIELQTSEELCR